MNLERLLDRVCYGWAAAGSACGTWLAVVSLGLVAACGTLDQAPTPNAVIDATFQSLAVFDTQVGQNALAGNLSAAKARSLLNETGRMRTDLESARALAGGCTSTPCEAFDLSMRGINRRLLVLQCRRRQAAAGLPEDDCNLLAPAPAASAPTAGSPKP